MTPFKRFLLASAVGAGLTGGAVAQTTGTTGTTGGSTTGGGGQASPQSSIQITQMETPTITAPSEASARSSAVATSNAFATFYNNPLYQGRAGALGAGLTTINAPGGFGTVLYSTTGGTGAAGGGGVGGAAGSNANRSVTTSGATGRTGATTGLGTATGTGLGGATGARGTTTGLGGQAATGGRAGGFGATGAGGNTAQNQQNQQLSTGLQIAYTQTLRFPAPAPIAPTQMQSELQTMLASSLTGAGGVQVTAGAGGVVLIRGAVADDDEVRLVENMIRLTPGVKEVKNELTTK